MTLCKVGEGKFSRKKIIHQNLSWEGHWSREQRISLSHHNHDDTVGLGK